MRFETKTDGPIIGYLVQWTTTVDRPELRDESYRPVPPGSKSLSERFVPLGPGARARAIRVFDGVLGSEWHFGSEYVSFACVVAVRQHRRLADWVRKNTYRTRAEADVASKRAA